ncbi:MAG: hypothetical protein K2J20_00945 [Bacilli bacterium]|nr:hypothetical protein [Bacilli bacterium]
MKKLINNKEFLLLVFIALFGVSIGLFDNYRELWMSYNNMSSITISHIISISYIITVLVLFYFTIKVSTAKLKNGILVTLILKMVTGTMLLCLNGTSYLFLMKLLMFFDIAFKQLIISSIYPLIMSIQKGDVIYTKKEVVMNIANKLGFLVVSVLLGRSIAGIVIDYNICLLFATVFLFLAFIVLINVDISSNKKTRNLDLNKTIKYFQKNNVLCLYLVVCLIGGIAWSAMIGMPMLTLTERLDFNPSKASFFVLGMGILSNIMAMVIVKLLRHKNDHVNIIFKFGLRVVLYLLVFLLNNKIMLIMTFVYLLLSDSTYGFIFDSYFINKVDEKYALLMTVLKYAASLTGNAIGTFICGLIFNLEIRYLALPSLIIGVIHYGMCTILINKKNELNC